MGTIKFYFDEMVSRVAAKQLLQQKIDVTLAADVDMVGKDDDTEHLQGERCKVLTMVE